MRHKVMLALLVVGLLLALAPPASADVSRATSEPNGDIFLAISAGSMTNRDRDENFDTATKNDKVSLSAGFINNTTSTQTFRVDSVLDGPGTEGDVSFTDFVTVVADGTHTVDHEVRVTKSTPRGQYILTVTVSGSETVTTMATFTVH